MTVTSRMPSPAYDAATKARVLTEVRTRFGSAWTDEHTELLYGTLIVLDQLGLFRSATPREEPPA